MPQITVKAERVKLVKKGLEDFAADVPQVSKARIYGRMVAAKNRITKYPPRWSGKLPKNWFKSDKQRRYVMMLVRSGKVPYQRTGAYGDSWKLETLPGDAGYRLTTKNSRAAKYAKYVGGDPYSRTQAKIHKGRWTVANDAITEEMRSLPREIHSGLVTAAHRRGL